jgi:hypothetical protein
MYPPPLSALSVQLRQQNQTILPPLLDPWDRLPLSQHLSDL